MPISLKPADTFAAPAAIRMPGGEVVEVEVTWRHKGRKAFDAWFESVTGRDDADVLAEVIVGWGAQIDAPYSRDALATLIDAYPSAALDLFAAYRAGLVGGRRKN